MPGWARKSDANQAEVVEQLRGTPGVGVHVLSRFPGSLDLLVGYRGRTYWIELKDSPDYTLTAAEERILETWPGHAMIAWSVEMILDAIGATR